MNCESLLWWDMVIGTWNSYIWMLWESKINVMSDNMINKLHASIIIKQEPIFYWYSLRNIECMNYGLWFKILENTNWSNWTNHWNGVNQVFWYMGLYLTNPSKQV